MPNVLPKPCRKVGCLQRTRNRQGYCDQHLTDAPKRDYKKEYQRRGREFVPLYNRRWSRARKAFLSDHPLCIRCSTAGIYNTATVVDHIVPHRGCLERFWDQTNWQALCKRCHDAKTAHEDRRNL